MDIRLGEMLIECRVLSEEQVETVLRHQRETGEPFGVICERLFNVDPEVIEETWARQYAKISQTVDPLTEVVDDRALDMVSRRQAWQFRVMPLRFDDDELMIVTTQRHLKRALRFATNVIGVPVYFVLTSADKLGEALCLHYPLPGMTAETVSDHLLDRLFRCEWRSRERYIKPSREAA